VISVPSGNFGNICAGMLAKQTGLPVKHFIAACNANDIVPQYLNSSVYQPKTAVATISNAMDVGDPSNFIRILEIFHSNYPDLKNNLTSLSVTDEQTLNTIEKVFKEKNYLLDPHGAIGYACLENYLAGSKEKGLFLETAHPVKFPDAIERAGLPTPEIPEELDAIMQKNKTAKTIPAGFNHFKEFLLSK
jgi:threonine synthase